VYIQDPNTDVNNAILISCRHSRRCVRVTLQYITKNLHPSVPSILQMVLIKNKISPYNNKGYGSIHLQRKQNLTKKGLFNYSINTLFFKDLFLNVINCYYNQDFVKKCNFSKIRSCFIKAVCGTEKALL
jgi:hypothetical protein